MKRRARANLFVVVETQFSSVGRFKGRSAEQNEKSNVGSFQKQDQHFNQREGCQTNIVFFLEDIGASFFCVVHAFYVTYNNICAASFVKVLMKSHTPFQKEFLVSANWLVSSALQKRSRTSYAFSFVEACEFYIQYAQTD